MKHFKVYSRHDILTYTKVRRFVTRVGEVIAVAGDRTNVSSSIEHSPCKYVLFGIPEDIGIRANM